MTRTINADELLEWLLSHHPGIKDKHHDKSVCLGCLIDHINQQLEQQEKVNVENSK